MDLAEELNVKQSEEGKNRQDRSFGRSFIFWNKKRQRDERAGFKHVFESFGPIF